MANPMRGERAVTIDGRALRLVYAFEAMARIEEKTGKPFGDFLAAMQAGLPWTDVPRVFWFGLADYHPDIDEAEARSLAGSYGVLETVTLIASAFSGAFFAKDPEAATGAARPRRKSSGRSATAGTGGKSSA